MSFETTTDEVLEGVDLQREGRARHRRVDRARSGDGTRARGGRRPRGARRVATAARIDDRRRRRSATRSPTRSSKRARSTSRRSTACARSPQWYCGDARPAAPADQQRGRDVHAVRTHRRRLRDAVRHQPRRALPADVTCWCRMLLADPPSRIVNLSSGGHRGSDIVWDDPNFERREYDKFSAYGQSKTANILFSVELDRRLADRGVHAYAVHPGMIATELGRHMTEDDFAAAHGTGEARTVGRAAAAQDGRAGRRHLGVGRHRPRARRAGRHLPRRRRGHRRARPLGPRPRVRRAPLDPHRGPRRPDSSHSS